MDLHILCDCAGGIGGVNGCKRVGLKPWCCQASDGLGRITL